MRVFFYNMVVGYFRFFATRQLRKNPTATTIGITGSAGKTSTRLALVHILRSHGVVKHSSHANSEIGLPLNILGLSLSSGSVLDWLRLLLLAPIRLLTYSEHYQYYVVELGIDSPSAPKNMATHLRLIHPDVGVVLNASLVHAGTFDHLVKDHHPLRRRAKLIKIIAKEKMLLLKSLNSKQVAVVNANQKELVDQYGEIAARIVTFGKSPRADLQIRDGFRYRYQGIDYHLVLRDIFPPQYAYTFGAAIAVAASLGIPPSIALPLLRDYRAPAGRLRIFAGIKGSKIIDSSYNASPSTMQDVLHLLKKIGGRGKKIAVLGDMRELGEITRVAHKELAEHCLSTADEVVLFGDSTYAYTYPLLKAKKFPVQHFTSMASLTQYLSRVITPKSVILVKGSQNEQFMERAVEAILLDKSDTTKLCRRGKLWDKLRRRTP